MQPATSTGLLFYWFPGEVFFTVNGEPGPGAGEALMQGRLVSGTQFQPDISTIRRIDVVKSTWSP